MRVTASERADLDELAARLNVPLGTAAKVAVRTLLTSINDSRPADTGRELNNLNGEETADVFKAYPGPQARITTAQ